MCGDSGIDSILITNPARVARQKNKLQGGIFTPALNDIDLADSYVPFEPPQSPGADSINTENMLGNTTLFILIAGLILGLVLLSSMIVTGNAIPSMQGVNYAHQGK